MIGIQVRQRGVASAADLKCGRKACQELQIEKRH
jgi:hypothetical protein